MDTATNSEREPTRYVRSDAMPPADRKYGATMGTMRPNAELRGASRLHGEASFSNDVLGAKRPGEDSNA